MSTKAATAEKNVPAKESAMRSQAHSAHTPESSSNFFDFAAAQQSAGNLAVQQLFHAGAIKAKLSISQPGDPDEEEADRVADRIMRMPDPASAVPCPGCSVGGEPCPKCAEQSSSQIRRKTNGTREPQQPSLASHVIGSLGAGHPLDKSTRAFFEPRLGSDLSHVRVHTGENAAESARAIQARAYTHGHNVVFDAGQYVPANRAGQLLLAHELTHVVQQEAGRFTGVVQRQQPTNSPATNVPSDATATADEIKRLIATRNDKEIVKLAAKDQELAISTPAQRAGMARILTDLTWTNEEEERATVALIKFGGQAPQVIPLIDSIAYRQKIIDSVDNEALHKELLSLLAAVPQNGASPDPAISKALSSQKSKDVVAITDFSKTTTMQRVGLLQILLSMSSTDEAEEAKMLEIIESGDVRTIMYQLKSLGLSQSLFDHIDAEANKKRLTATLGKLDDPALNKDLEVFNRGYWGNVWEGIKGGVKSAWKDFSIGNVIMGILKPIIHPIDTIVDLFDQAVEFLKNPTLGGLLAFLRDLSGTVAMWLLILSGITSLIVAALAAGVITIPAAIPVGAIDAFLISATFYMTAAFLVFAGLKFLLDLHQAGTATTQPELETKQKEIGDDLTLGVLLLLFAGLMRGIKKTLKSFKGGAIDPEAAKPEALKETAKDAKNNQQAADQNVKDMQNQAANPNRTGDPNKTVDPTQQPGPKPPDSAPAGMADSLKKIRAALSDNAQRQFDKMFDRLKGDSKRMEKVLDSMPKGDALDKRLAEEWDKANKPKTPTGEAIGKVPEVKAQAEKLLQEIEDYRNANPQIGGKWSILKALRGELVRLERMLKGEVEATKEGVEGTKNNIEGVQSEFDAIKGAQDVVAAGKTFSLDNIPDKVEVDVVADKGKTWIDRKKVKPFGLDSTDWKGDPGKGKQGLKTQAEEMKRSGEQNPVNGDPPKVVIDFPEGVSPEVYDALRKIGVEPRGDIVRPELPSVPPVVQDKDRDQPSR